MTFQAHPTVKGVYRVKVYNSGKDDYWKYMWDGKPWTAMSLQAPWIKLTVVDESSDRFKVVNPTCTILFRAELYGLLLLVEYRSCGGPNRLFHHQPSRRYQRWDGQFHG